jgi:phosphoribosylformylglycinamidine synthase
VACAGGEPIGATNNLNFGNPERPEIMWQIGEAVRGIGDACRALGAPITGGNVSLYNETEGRAIFPTPVIGVVGILEDASKTATRTFKTDGSAVVLLGDNSGELGGSEYLATVHGTVAGKPPVIDLKREAALQALILKLIRDGCIESAHDCSEGGLAIALAECTFDTGGLGVSADITAVAGNGHVGDGPMGATFAINATLFGESASRIVVSVASRHLDAVVTAANTAGVPVREIGRVGGDRIRISVNGQSAIDTSVAAAETAWATAIENKMAGNRKPGAGSRK